MCTTCGCGLDSDSEAHQHDHETETHSSAHHSHIHTLEKRILAANEGYAQQLKEQFTGSLTTAFNLLSSPGAGKTTLLVETLKQLQNSKYQPLSLAVIEGDQHTQRDVERIRKTGTPAQQINTGKVCHLEAKMIWQAISGLSLEDQGILFIENVGNLICPAEFDLGEHKKVVLFATTEGEDKPIKYPHIFHAADLIVITKTDLLPHLNFDLNQAREFIRQVNPQARIITLSSEHPGSEAFQAWLDWLLLCRSDVLTGSDHRVRVE